MVDSPNICGHMTSASFGQLDTGGGTTNPLALLTLVTYCNPRFYEYKRRPLRAVASGFIPARMRSREESFPPMSAERWPSAGPPPQGI